MILWAALFLAQHVAGINALGANYLYLHGLAAAFALMQYVLFFLCRKILRAGVYYGCFAFYAVLAAIEFLLSAIQLLTYELSWEVLMTCLVLDVIGAFVSWKVADSREEIDG